MEITRSKSRTPGLTSTDACLFDRVDQWRQSLDADLEPVPGLDRSYAAGCPGQDDVPGQQGEVCRNKADELVTVEDELAGVRVLAQLPVLEQLNRQIVRVDFRFHVRSQRSERVERFGACPLALGVLNGPVAHVLRGGVAENVARGGGRRDVADTAADHNGQFRLEIRSMVGERNLDLAAVWQKRRWRLQPEQGFLGNRFARFTRVIGVV